MKFLNDINHLRWITFYMRSKTYLKDHTNGTVGMYIGVYFVSILFLISSFIRFINNQYHLMLTPFIIAILLIFIFAYGLGQGLYHIYNSKTYSLEQDDNSTYIFKNKIKYFIILKLKNGEFLLQTKDQINNSLGHNHVEYYVYSKDNKMLKVGCSDNMINNLSPKICRKIVYNKLLIFILIIISICCAIYLLKSLSGISLFKILNGIEAILH